jgi:ribosomal protein L40E
LSYPELYSDESVVLQAQNVKVKSVVFEAVLTTRRLVLIDAKKSSIPPQEINLATLKDVECGENAIRDPTITISIITISGNTRQMVLTFSKTSGGERRRECDDWVRALKQNITSTVYHPITQTPPAREPEPAPGAQPSVSPLQWIEIPNTPPPKKRIEIARPMKKIIETAPAMPVPVETTSLPTGSFCNRCGSRVPSESAFCNRCGTPVVQETESVNLPPPVMPVPVETTSLPTGSFCNRCGNRVPLESAFCNRCGTQVVQGTESVNMPPVEVTGPLQQPAPVAPQLQVTPPTAVTENKDSRIEEVIHTIEPLIEDSVPRTAPAPLVPAKQVHYAAPYADTAESASQAPPVTNKETPLAAAQPGDVQWPVLSQPTVSDTATPSAAPVAPPVPGSSPPLPQKKSPLKFIAVTALVILAVIAGAYFFMQGPAGTPGVTPTPEVTVPATTAPQTTVTTVATTRMPTPVTQVQTPSLLTPTSGVWVKVTYPNKFSGTVGTPEWSREVEDSGDQFYQISTSNGPVVVSIQKSDGTSATLAVDVYKDGTLIKHAQTTSPKGIIEFQAPLKEVTTTPTAAQ